MVPALSMDMAESAVRSLRGACRGGVAGSNSMAASAAGDRGPAGEPAALGASAHMYGNRSSGMCSAKYGCLSSSAHVTENLTCAHTEGWCPNGACSVRCGCLSSSSDTA